MTLPVVIVTLNSAATGAGKCMERHLQQIEQAIGAFRFAGQPRSLYDPIHYMMSLGGKRIRPLLTLLAYELYRSDSERIARYAAAVEAFHNFTLVHDDIMDGAPIRRGKPSVHVKWDTNTAILSGDVMLVKVYEQFMDLASPRLQKVLTLFGACATSVCEGQQWDMAFEKMDRVTEDQYIRMIQLKTAALLGFSLELGAVLAEAPETDQVLLREIGINLGIAFQLKDDLLDVYADKKAFGKQHGGDIIANKKTFLLIHAQKRAKGANARELTRWLRAKKFSKPKKVKAVTAIYDSLRLRELTSAKIQEYLDRAVDGLGHLSVKAKTSAISDLVQELAGRQK